MFRIKICGLTTPDDAREAVAAGADAIGLNFFSGSPRFVTAEQAQEIGAVISAEVARVGVFVNSSPTEIDRIATIVGLDWIQLHGNETPEMVAELIDSRPIIRVHRQADRASTGIQEDLIACQRAGRSPAAVLVDAAAPGKYGGTGITVRWTELADHQSWLGETPLILAGGLTPENVAEAISTARPEAVDVASGVESSTGVKDVAKMRSFVQSARASFAEFDH